MNTDPTKRLRSSCNSKSGKRQVTGGEIYSPPGAGMSASDIIAALESSDFDLYNATSLESTLIGSVCMDLGHKTLKCHQITNPTRFSRTQNRHFQDWSTRNKKNYSPETANIDERRDRSSQSPVLRGRRFYAHRGPQRYTYRSPSNPTIEG